MDYNTRPIWPSSALLTIDMQKDFSFADAPAYIQGTEAILPRLTALVKHFRRKNRPIVHIVRLYQPDGSNADICRRKAIREGAQIVEPGTEGAELVDALRPDAFARLDTTALLDGKPRQLGPGEWILYKPRWGAFYNTRLDDLLQRLEVSTVVVAGCNFPNCPRTTIYEASERDYRIAMARDAVSGLYERGERELKDIGVALFNVDQIGRLI